MTTVDSDGDGGDREPNRGKRIALPLQAGLVPVPGFGVICWLAEKRAPWWALLVGCALVSVLYMFALAAITVQCAIPQESRDRLAMIRMIVQKPRSRRSR